MDYMKRNIDSWHKLATKVFASKCEKEDILFVNGWTKTIDWISTVEKLPHVVLSDLEQEIRALSCLSVSHTAS